MTSLLPVITHMQKLSY